MTTLTIELPENLSHQIHTREISQKTLKDLFIRGLEVFLRKEMTTSTFPIENEVFTRQKVVDHRDVFEPTGQVYRYPTVSLPASSLDGWLNLISEGYEGNAVADTEALYEEI